LKLATDGGVLIVEWRRRDRLQRRESGESNLAGAGDLNADTRTLGRARIAAVIFIDGDGVKIVRSDWGLLPEEGVGVVVRVNKGAHHEQGAAVVDGKGRVIGRIGAIDPWDKSNRRRIGKRRALAHAAEAHARSVGGSLFDR